MDKNSINTIISLLPEKVIYDAACRYVVKLAQGDNLEKAENLYHKLYIIAPDLERLGEAARSLVARHVVRHEINQALSIYEHFPDYEMSCSTLAEKLKTCHILIFALIPKHFIKAYELWLEYVQYNLNPCLKWQWAETGLALLKCCYQLGLSEMAAEIYPTMKKYGNCEISKAFMDKAEQLMVKINTQYQS